MDRTFEYSLAAGIALVFLFVLARFAFRWFIRLTVVAVILVVLAGAIWVWRSYSSPRPELKPQSNTRRTGTDRK